MPRPFLLARPVLVGAALLAASCSSGGKDASMAPEAQLVTETYTSPVYGWSVAYPREWTLDSSNPASVRLRPPQAAQPALVGVNTRSLSSIDAAIRTLGFSRVDGNAVDTYVAFYEGAFRREGKRVVLLSRTQITLRGEVPATELVYELGTGVVGKARIVLVFRGDIIYEINAETFKDSFENVRAEFDLIIASFRP